MSALPQNKRLWIAGHSGLVGGALMRHFSDRGFTILTESHANLDLRDQNATRQWIAHNRPDSIIMAAGRVGGIGANNAYPVEFLYDNMMMAANVIHAAAQEEVEKLIYLGSSCIYPRDAAQPIVPDSLLTGSLEQTNEAYALAKITGVRLCQYYRRQYGFDFTAVMPCNLYGPGDRFDLENSHVIPALIMKFHAARTNGHSTVTLWGTGKPVREFLYADDLARAIDILVSGPGHDDPVNIGAGEGVSISVLAQMIAGITGFRGDLVFNPEKPDGTPYKVMDSSVIRGLGWTPVTSLPDGLGVAYDWYCRSLLSNVA